MEREPTLADLLKELWQAKAFVLGGGLLGLIGAVLFLALAVPHYRATMLVAPTENRIAPHLQSLSPDDSSLAVQEMIDAQGKAAPQAYARFENTLRGASAAAELMKDRKILAGIAKDRRFVVSGDQKPQSAEALAAYLQTHVGVEPVGMTPLRRLVYKHPDRRFAGYFLTRLYHVTDDLIRQDENGKTQGRAVYLQKALDNTSNPDHRRVLTAMLMGQQQEQMMLAMEGPYAASVAEPPSAGVRPYWPRKSIVLPVGMLAGLLLGYMMFSVKRTETA